MHVQLAVIQLPPPGPHLAPTQVAAFAFDTSQELLWTGNEFVRMARVGRLLDGALMTLGRDASLLSMARTSSDIPPTAVTLQRTAK